MLSEGNARKALHILIPVFLALFSICICTKKLPEMKLYTQTIESLDESRDVVAKLTTGCMGLSLVIDFLPEDYGSSLAGALAEFDKYFVLLLVAIFLERMLAIEGTSIALTYLFPAACATHIVAFLTKRDGLDIIAKKIATLAVAIALVVPFGTRLAAVVGQNYLEYVNETIDSAAQYSTAIGDNLTETDEDNEQTLIERFSGAISSAITSIKDIADNLKVVITKFMNSIAILIVTTCVVPAATFYFLMWLLGQLFSIDTSRAMMAMRIPEVWGKRSRKDDGESGGER